MRCLQNILWLLSFSWPGNLLPSIVYIYTLLILTHMHTIHAAHLLCLVLGSSSGAVTLETCYFASRLTMSGKPSLLEQKAGY